jgi:hypothetical protein
MKRPYFTLAIVIIGILYLFVRFYKFPARLEFRQDQGFFLLESKSTIESPRIRLLGPVTSKTYQGRGFFVGSGYYYLLGIVGKIFNWDPLLITGFFTFLDFIFYLFFIIFLHRKFGAFWSLLVFLSISVSPYLIGHSLFFWNPHLLVPLSIAVLHFLDKFFRTKKYLFLSIAAVCWGFAFSCHYSPIFWLPIFIYYIYKSDLSKKFITWFLLIIFVIIGDLPFFIFEIRHQFYNLRTFFFIYSHSSNNFGFTSHYFVFPLLIFIIYFSLSKMPKYLFLIILLTVTLYQFVFFRQNSSFGYIPDWRFPDQLKALNLILADGCPQNYNIATTISGDTRSYDLRSLLTIKKCPPLPVEIYPQASTVYLIAPPSRPPQTETVWEISSFKPFTVKSMVKLNDNVILYHLEKTHASNPKNN